MPHAINECQNPSSNVLLAESLGDALDSTLKGTAGSSVFVTPVDGNNTYIGYCLKPNSGQWSLARMFGNASWRHYEPRAKDCDPPSSGAVLLNVAFVDGHAKAMPISVLADFRYWSIKQGNGSAGYAYNKYGATSDGTLGYWYP